MSIVVDIRTRVFGEDDVAYRLFPGEGYRHFKTMKDHSVIFVDNPGLPMPPNGGFSKDDATLQALARSELVRPYVLSRRDDALVNLNEAMESEVAGVRWGRRRELNLSWLNELYVTASVGDLVVVPSPGFIRDDEGQSQRVRTLVGEIVGETERWEPAREPRLRAAKYLVRRMKWLGEVNELNLEVEAAGALRTRNALIKVRASQYQEAIGAAYKNILLEGEFLSRFSTQNPTFKSFESYHFNAFSLAVSAALLVAFQNAPRFRDGESIYEVAARVGRESVWMPEQESSIHSPGYMTLRGGSLTPAVVSALFVLALASAADMAFSPVQADGISQVNVVNSESARFDPCDAGIEAAVRQSLEIIGYERWQEMCRAAVNAHVNDGLESISTVDASEDGEQ